MVAKVFVSTSDPQSVAVRRDGRGRVLKRALRAVHDPLSPDSAYSRMSSKNRRPASQSIPPLTNRAAITKAARGVPPPVVLTILEHLVRRPRGGHNR